MGWVLLILIASFVLAVLPLVLSVLQRRGVAWTYRVGFPVATYWRDGPLDVSPSDMLVLDERDDMVLIRERSSPTPFRWPAGVVGRVERVGQRTRLQFVTDWNATVSWAGLVFYGAAALSLPFIAPEFWDSAASWPERIGLLAVAAVVPGLAAGSLGWMRRRARTKSGTYAEMLGFDRL